MRNYFIFMISLTVLFSCSSERSFPVQRPQGLQPAADHESAQHRDAASSVQGTPGLRQGDASDSKEKANRVPALTYVKLVPEVFHPGDTLGVAAKASDEDGDDVSILYAWFVNEQPAGHTSRLAVPVKRGDKFRVRVTPFDGKEEGRSAVLSMEVKNMPPMFRQVGQGVLAGETYTCQVAAVDRDGDPLTYGLKTAPKGMKISPDTGLMTWNVPADFTGVEKVLVTAEDGHGGKSEYNLKVTIKEEEPGVDPQPGD